METELTLDELKQIYDAHNNNYDCYCYCYNCRWYREIIKIVDQEPLSDDIYETSYDGDC